MRLGTREAITSSGAVGGGWGAECASMGLGDASAQDVCSESSWCRQLGLYAVRRV